MLTRRAFATQSAAFLAAAGLPARAGAQGKYPSRPIEVVVPFAPGGGTDNLMRTIVGIIDENKWSPVPINVNNRAGGSGAIGYTYLLNKKGDPHVIAGAAPTIVSAKVEGRLPGNHRDMTVLMIVAIDELMLSVRSESKYQTIEDFVKDAKARPGQLTIAGTGTNSEDHIFTYLFEQAAGIKVPVLVSYGSNGAVHHRHGMTHAADLLGCPLVVLEGCRHDAPMSHAGEFRRALIDPLLRLAGPPWAG